MKFVNPAACVKENPVLLSGFILSVLDFFIVWYFHGFAQTVKVM